MTTLLLVALMQSSATHCSIKRALWSDASFLTHNRIGSNLSYSAYGTVPTWIGRQLLLFPCELRCTTTIDPCAVAENNGRMIPDAKHANFAKRTIHGDSLCVNHNSPRHFGMFLNQWHIARHDSCVNDCIWDPPLRQFFHLNPVTMLAGTTSILFWTL